MRRTIAGLALGVLVVGALVGCGSEPFVTSVACASWADYESEEDMTADAGAVIAVDDLTRDGTASVLGFDAHAYTATVRESEKGPLEVGETVRVASTADNCAASPYGEGDPLEAGGTLRLYLYDEDGLWRTLTPFDGVVPAG